MPVQDTHDVGDCLFAGKKISLDYDFLSNAKITENNGVLLLSRKTILDTAPAQNSYMNEIVYIVPDAETSIAELKADINNYLYSTRTAGNKTETNYDTSGSDLPPKIDLNPKN